MSTAKDGIDIDLINEAIDASIKFESLMEKIDFNSWYERIGKNEEKKPDTKANLSSIFDKQAYEQYGKWVKKAENKCEDFINNDYEKSSYNKTDVKPFVKSLIHYLFKAKLKRLEARRTSYPKVEKNKYIEVENLLNSALNKIPLIYLQNPLKGSRKKDFDLLIILFYNDLSICYAGFKNSSMSRGFAEKSLDLLSEDGDYIEFKREICNLESKIERGNARDQDYKKLIKLQFVSGESKKYDLYTFALFCKAVAEFRSFLKEESEKTFGTVIDLVDKFRCPKNSDYISALLQLASLLNDLSRSKEAIDTIQKLQKNNLDKMDRRWAEGLLEKASAFIDQGLFIEARKILEKLSDFKKLETEKKSFSEPVLNGLVYYGRSYLEESKNIIHKKGKLKEDSDLKKAKGYLEEAYKRSEQRKQKNLIQKSAKYLAEVYNTDKDNLNTLKYYSISISERGVNDFEDLLKSTDQKLEYYVQHCEDGDILENFSMKISEDIIDNYETKKCNVDFKKEIHFCILLLDKLKKESKEKGNVVLSEKTEQIKQEIEFITQNRNKDCVVPRTLEEPDFTKLYDILTGNVKKEKPGEKNFLNREQMKERLDRNEKTFDNVLYGRTDKIKKSLVELIVLRRWNSFSPGLSRRHAISLGGGYLLRIWAPKFQKAIEKNLDNRKNDKQDSRLLFNIVIDPGYNFLHNFHSENFKIQDIDAIVVSHSHPDHCAELFGVMDLLRQINKRQKDGENRKRVYLLLSEGAYKKFSPYIHDWKEQLKDVVILKDKTEWPKKNQNLEFKITAIQTAHADLGGARAIGITVEIKSENDLLLGFTGDTPWRKYIEESFKNCDLLCLHMGGIKNEEIGYDEDGEKRIDVQKVRCKETTKRIKKANHLLFYGSKDIINSCKTPGSLVIVGEFGEELKYGLRIDLVKKLNFPRDDDPFCIPADSGLYLIITDEDKKQNKKLRCDFCREFVPPKEIEIFAYGLIDSLHYICNACNHTLTESQKRTIIEYQLTRH